MTGVKLLQAGAGGGEETMPPPMTEKSHSESDALHLHYTLEEKLRMTEHTGR